MSKKIIVEHRKSGCMSGCIKLFVALFVIGIIIYVAAFAGCVLAGVGLWFLIRYVWRLLAREKPDSNFVKWGMSKAPIVRKVLAGIVSAIVAISLMAAVGSGMSNSGNSRGSSSGNQSTQEKVESKDDQEKKSDTSTSDSSASSDDQAADDTAASAKSAKTPAFNPDSYGLRIDVSTPGAGSYRAIVSVYGTSDADFPTMRQAIIDAAAHYELVEDANTVGAEFDSLIGSEGGSGTTWDDGGIITSAPNGTETTYRADLYVKKRQ